MHAGSRHGIQAILVCGALVLSTGCEDDKASVDQPAEGSRADAGGKSDRPEASDAGDAGASDAGGDDADSSDKDRVYLYKVNVYHPDGTSAYALLRDTIDFEITVDDLDTAREFPGYTGMGVFSGDVVSADSESPFATKWRITEDRQWEQVGEPLNFGQYFMSESDGLNFHWQAVRGDDVYLFYGAERTSRAHWNVKDWRILDAYEDTNLPTKAGYELGNPGNRSNLRDFKGAVVWPFTLENDETGAAPKSYLAVYDPDTHAESAVIESSCPRIQQATKDEEGNLYFSTFSNDPSFAFYGDAAANCVVKVTPDGELDETFGNQDFRDATDGGILVGFRYLKDGKGVASVAHPDRLPEFDPDGPFDPEVACKIWICDDKPDQFDKTLWDVHVIDLAAGTSKIVTGWKEGEEPWYYTIYYPLDNRIFLNSQIVPNGEWADVYNGMYELDVETAKVTRLGQTVGDLQEVLRVR
jgi:hypothetical protein